MRTCAVVLSWFVAMSAHAQDRDLRAAHAICAASMVRIDGDDGLLGSGWVVELGGHEYVVTNRHVAEGQTDVWVEFEGGSGSVGVIVFLSDRIDVALIEIPDGDIPVEPLRFVHGSVARGERVVIGGNPGGLSFITTEGVVAGYTADTEAATAACGTRARDACLVIDAETEPGSSGGPVIDDEGHVIGMIWGVYSGASFSIAISAESLALELLRGGRVLAARR